ncbi:MAG: hypothetical protein K0V04_31755 [Deltaproteobacteria bacterium]|nr:hypothetical protein [Deltaproteobacteria bacterium]
MRHEAKIPYVRRLLTPTVGMTLCVLAPACDEAPGENALQHRAGVVSPEQMSTVFLDEDVFDEVLESWSEPELGSLEADLAAGGSSGDASEICSAIGDDPDNDSAQCASSKGHLANLMMNYAGLNEGSQCVMLANIKDNVRIGTAVDDEETTENSKDGIHYRVNRQGPAASYLVTGFSRGHIHEDNEHQLASRDASAVIRVMNVCYDDAGKPVKDGPSAKVRLEAETHGKITVINQSTNLGQSGNSLGKGEFIAGTNRYMKDANEWKLLNGTEAKNLALSRSVSHSTWTPNWGEFVPALIDVADWAARYFFPSYQPLVDEWIKVGTGEAQKTPNPKSVGTYLKKTADDFRKLFVVVGKDDGHNGRTTQEDKNKINDLVLLKPFDQVTYQMASRVKTTVRTQPSGPLRQYRNFTSVAMASDFGFFLAVEFPIEECNKLSGEARAACRISTPVGYFMAGTKNAENISTSLKDFYNGQYSEGKCGPDEHPPPGPVAPPAICIDYGGRATDVYSVRDFDTLATNAEFVARNFGWDDTRPDWANTPVADMVAKIKAAKGQGLTVVEGMLEVQGTCASVE